MRTTMTRYRGYKIITTDMYGMYDVRRSNGEYIGFGETITEARNIARDDMLASKILPVFKEKIEELNGFRIFLENKCMTAEYDRYKDDYNSCYHDLTLVIEIAALQAGCTTEAIWRVINNRKEDGNNGK